MAAPVVEAVDAATITVRVPVSFRRLGGRKLVMGDDGTTTPTQRPPSALPMAPVVKALARAFPLAASSRISAPTPLPRNLLSPSGSIPPTSVESCG